MKRKFSIALTLAVLLAMALTSLALADSTPTITSDLPDYNPGETVILSGAGWQPGESIKIVTNDDIGNIWYQTDKVVALDDGSFTDTFQLPTSFVATYSVTATGAISGTATTTFTDATNYNTTTTLNAVTTPLTNGNSYSFSGSVNTTSPDPAVPNGATVNLAIRSGGCGSSGWTTLASATTSGGSGSYSGNFTAPAEGKFGFRASFPQFTTGSGGSAINWRTSDSACQVIVVRIHPIITFDPAPTPAYLGGNFTVNATTTNTDSSVLTYSAVSGPCALVSGATFSSSGPGTCVVQASGAATTNFYAATQTQNVTISKANQAALIVNPLADLTYNTSEQMTTTGGSVIDQVTYHLNSGPCTIVGDMITANSGAPNCKLYATKAGDDNYKDVTSDVITVNLVKAAQDPLILHATSPLSNTQSETLNVTGGTTDGLVTYHLVSGPCTLAGALLTANASTGSCIVTATMAGDNDYLPVTSDQVTVNLVPSNSPPTAGTISGANPVNEGSSHSYTSDASDPDVGDTLSYVWSVSSGNASIAGGQGTNSVTLEFPDGPDTVVLNLVVGDGHVGHDVSPTDMSITVNNVAPTIAISGATSVDEGSTYSLTLGAVTDPGTDTVTSFIVHWGDTSSDTYTTAGVKTHTYDDGPNTYAITVDLVDEDGTFLDAANDLSVDVLNVAPTATFSNNGPKDEGSPATISFTNQYDPSTADTSAGFHYAYSCTNGDLSSATYLGSGTNVSTTCTWYHEGTYTVKARIMDKDNGYNEYTTNVVMNNVAPTITSVVPGAAASCGSVTGNTITVNFTDPGTADTWTARVNWGDGLGYVSLGSVSLSSFTASHTYAHAGVYTVLVIVTDDFPADSNIGTTSVTLNYNLSDMLQPILPGHPGSIFKYGSVIPVKVTVQDCDGSYPANLTLHVGYSIISSDTPTSGVSEPVISIQADTGNIMRFSYPQYIFNLATKTLSDSTASYRLWVTVDATLQRVYADIGLKIK